MFHKRKYDKRSGLYKTKCNINDFEFRIHIKSLFSLIEIPDFDLIDRQRRRGFVKGTQGHHDDRRAKEGGQQRNSHDHLFECGWQQSKSELTANLDESEDAIPAVEEMQGTRQVRVFTVGHEELQQEAVGRLAGEGRVTEKTVGVSDLDGLFAWYSLKDNNRPHGQRMMVMAELEQQEVCLVEMQWDEKDNTLHIYPDFNDLSDNPYLIEFDRKAKGQMILYAIQPKKGKRRQKKKKGERELRIAKPLGTIRLPQRNHFQALLLFTFITAQDFDHDNLHFKYVITANKDTRTDVLLTSATHSVSRGPKGVFNISHCFEHALEVAYQDAILGDGESAALQMTIEGYSVDTWQRERYHGFSSLVIPLSVATSMSERTLPFVMEQENTLTERLQRFFIGGHKKIARDQSAGSILYGNAVKASGQLAIAYSLVIQQDGKSSGGGELLERSTLIKDLDAIIHGFKKSCSLIEFE